MHKAGDYPGPDGVWRRSGHVGWCDKLRIRGREGDCVGHFGVVLVVLVSSLIARVLEI